MTHTPQAWTPDPHEVLARIKRRSFCVLATASPDATPHSAGVLYVFHEGAMYVNTLRRSRKARDVAANPAVAVCVPIRRVPFGPPSTVQLRAHGDVLGADDPSIAPLIADGTLRHITGHGELDEPDGCFLRLKIAPRIGTYGLGMSLRQLVRDPLHAGGSVQIPSEPHTSPGS